MAGRRIYGDLVVEGDVLFTGGATIGRANVSGTEKTLTILSSDANCGLDIVPQGTGVLRVPTGYEANILSESRALVNKSYSDGYLTGKVIPTPGASEDGKVPQYNHVSGEFTWVTPGGGGGGSVSFGTVGQIPITNSLGNDFVYSSSITFDSTNNALTVGSSRIHTRGGSTNFFAGNSVANFTLTGNENVGIGGSVLQSLSTGVRNVVIGYLAGLQVSTGGQNTIIGAESGVAIQTGSSNTLIGAIQANLLTGSSNTLIGSSAGFGNITSASNCIIIGAGCAIPSGTANGQMSIQNIIYGTGNTTTGISVGLGSIGIGTVAPDRRFHVEQDTATTNAVTYVQRLTSTSSGTPANGIGVGLEFEVETSASNNEVGATIEAVVTDVTGASEDFDLVFKTMVAGAAATEHLRFGSNKIGFFGATTVAKQAGLTTMTHTAPGTPDYAIQDLTAVGGFGFATKDEGNTVLSIVKAMHDALKNYGLLT